MIPEANQYHHHNPGEQPGNRCDTCGYLPEAIRHQVTIRNHGYPVHTQRNLLSWAWAVIRSTITTVNQNPPKKLTKN